MLWVGDHRIHLVGLGVGGVLGWLVGSLPQSPRPAEQVAFLGACLGICLGLTVVYVKGRREGPDEEQEEAALNPQPLKRSTCFAAALGGAGALILNHLLGKYEGEYYWAITLVGALALPFGLLGSVFPRFTAAIPSGRGREPVWRFVVFMATMAAGLLLGWVLWYEVY